MEDSKEANSKNLFLHEYYDQITEFFWIQSEDDNWSILNIPIGFVKYDDLYKWIKLLSPMKESKQIVAAHEHNFYDWSNNIVDNHKAQLSEKDKQILEAYFIHRLKPKEISSKYWVSRSRIYQITEEIKKVFIKYKADQLNKPRHCPLKDREVYKDIEEFWKLKRHTCYTVKDVRDSLKYKHPGKNIPSITSIRMFMKKSLKLSYKRVSWRPYKIQTKEFVQKRIEYIEFVKALANSGHAIIQVDEFTVNRLTRPAMAWMRRTDPAYAIQEPQGTRFSNIVAISEWGWELLTI